MMNCTVNCTAVVGIDHIDHTDHTDHTDHLAEVCTVITVRAKVKICSIRGLQNYV